MAKLREQVAPPKKGIMTQLNGNKSPDTFDYSRLCLHILDILKYYASTLYANLRGAGMWQKSTETLP